MNLERGDLAAEEGHTLLIDPRKLFVTAMLWPVLVLGATGCSSESPAPPLSTGSSRSPSKSPSDDPSSTPRFRAEDVRIKLRKVAAGLTAPLGVTHAGDDSGLLFVAEQRGTIRIIEDGRVRPETFLDISSRIVSGGEQGLLGLAFHPSYSNTGRFYVNYTDLNGDTVVAEYRRSPNDPLRSDPGSERVLLQVGQPFANHNGGGLAFGPDGYLYIALGDGGSGGDPQGNGQSLDTHLGKMLRIDVDEREGGRAYSIPEDNPFADDDSDARPEIWAYGLRNPFRFSFDRATGTLWIGDVGQDEIEEIDRAGPSEGGLNFGWNLFEGSVCYPSGKGCAGAGTTKPVTEYSHDEGCTVIGGYVYRGRDHSNLDGGYLFADFCSGAFFAIDSSAPSGVAPTKVLESGRSISSFGEDQEGELYVTDISTGELLQIVSQ